MSISVQKPKNFQFRHLDPSFMSHQNLQKLNLAIEADLQRHKSVVDIFSTNRKSQLQSVTSKKSIMFNEILRKHDLPLFSTSVKNSSVRGFNRRSNSVDFQAETIRSPMEGKQFQKVLQSYEFHEQFLDKKFKISENENSKINKKLMLLKNKLVTFNSALNVISPAISTEKVRLNKLLTKLKSNMLIDKTKKKQLQEQISFLLINKPFDRKTLKRSEFIKSLYDREKQYR